jgi:hypothetical protein
MAVFGLFWGKLLKIALVRFYGQVGAFVWPASDRSIQRHCHAFYGIKKPVV